MKENNNGSRLAKTSDHEMATTTSTRKRKKKKSKSLYYLVLVILLAVFVFSAYKIVSYMNQKKQSEKTQAEVVNEFVTPAEQLQTPENEQQENTEEPNTTEETPLEENNEEKKEEKTETVKKEPEPEQISIDFSALKAKYPDVVGYIYGANTGISYPIVQGSDDVYYLDHSIDGSSNNNGSIFMEYLNSSGFSDSNTILYGHNMKSGRMFAALTNYKSQSYYDAHPYLYIYTPYQNYRLNLFAGVVCPADADIYTLNVSSSLLSSYVSQSTFKSSIGVPTGNIVTLSTCSYEADNYRYVVLGVLVPIS